MIDALEAQRGLNVDRARLTHQQIQSEVMRRSLLQAQRNLTQSQYEFSADSFRDRLAKIQAEASLSAYETEGAKASAEFWKTGGSDLLWLREFLKVLGGISNASR